jgi:outer membrane receptor protein involved in Fe transport
VDLSYPYDAGANRLFNLFAFWRPHERFTGFARLGYFSSQDLIFPVAAAGENSVVSYPGVWLVDLAATLREVLGSGTELRVSVRNLTDREYRIPGTYSAMEGRPFTFEAAISKRW